MALVRKQQVNEELKTAQMCADLDKKYLSEKIQSICKAYVPQKETNNKYKALINDRDIKYNEFTLAFNDSIIATKKSEQKEFFDYLKDVKPEDNIEFIKGHI